MKEVAVMKEKDLKEALMELGREKGVITFEELNAAFPAEYCPLVEMEHFIKRLDHMGVRVVEGRKHAKVRLRNSQAA